MRCQIDPERDAELTRRFHAMLDRAWRREARRDQAERRRRSKETTAIIGWVRVSTALLGGPD